MLFNIFVFCNVLSVYTGSYPCPCEYLIKRCFKKLPVSVIDHRSPHRLFRC